MSKTTRRNVCFAPLYLPSNKLILYSSRINKMTTKDFSINLPSNQSASDVFKAVTQVKKWWSGFYEEEINGESSKLNDEFTFRAGNGIHYSKQKLIEVVQDKHLVWLVTESKLTFLKKTDEWTGTKIIFDIIEK